ncbi:type VI secretion system membrane subunit TssM [Bartonella sp. HY329]|uniref:type VI secretion system membrane subunit TssM n=1 Tax=unclassified Bartonella TaxID=2645622 RepID=UPI0021C89EE8|nr:MULTISPECIES: type VI secretion system membrane subunit TssM [unclassified Bartonella]UXM95227.1 type VI secretion system membrane subunit TssM [Bartonella sp. HY329]UXN09551.1 type VI secretion system membrane subunit TssM [Bartonella sp. HY328]
MQNFGGTSLLSRLSSTFRMIARGFGSGLFISTIILIVLACLVWFYGPGFQYLEYTPLKPVANRIIVIGVLIILWGLNNYFLARAAAKKKPKKQVEEEIKPRDPVSELIAILNSSFLMTMKTIKDKWMGKDKGARTLYAMPWYLIIGPTASGKTTLIQDSDLNFPLTHELKQGHINKTVSDELPQYWVTRESVLFDIPGSWLDMTTPISFDGLDSDEIDPNIPVVRTTVKDSRKRLWNAFTDLLNSVRPRRPINGVVLTFDVVDVIRMDADARNVMSMNIHARLVEIAEKLGTRFTVHVVMTKLDRLAGFRDYFAQLTKAERQEPFGFSFSVFDELQADEWVENFEKEFAKFLTEANDDLIDRVNNQKETEIRKNIYTFLREFAASGPIVAEFFRKALLSDRFSTPPMVRGIYFTSTVQEGAPFNALLTKISNDYHMTSPVMPAYSGNSTPYFTSKLFTNVIFREAGLAGDNQTVEKHKRFVLRATILASSIGILIFGFILAETSKDNIARANNVLKASQNFINLPRYADISGSEAQFLSALNAISAANSEFPNWQDKSEVRRFAALYQGGRVGPEVNKAYEDLLRDRFMPSIADKVKAEIIRLGEDPQTYNSDERLDALRVYLLLGDIQRRKELDSSDDTMSIGKKAVIAWLQKDWQKRFEGENDVQAGLARHLNYALSTNHIAAPLDQQLVTKTQLALREVPRDVRLYRNLKTLAQRQVPNGLSLRNAIGPSFDIVFKQADNGEVLSHDVTVPYFYTKRGFLDFFVPKSQDLSVIAVEDAWVTGERKDIRYSEEDLQAFIEKIRHAYATDYINYWTNMINNLNISDFRNIDDAGRVLSEINGPSAPFGRLLNLIKSETEIYSAEPTQVNADQPQTQILFDKNREHALRITRAFADLSALVTAKEGQTPPLEEMMASLSGLEAYMRAILAGQQSSKPVALEKAQERAKLQGDDPIFVIRRTGTNMPKPFDKFYAQIADNSWKVILDAAKKDLQSVWQNSVYRTFNVELAGRYPFNINSKEEVSLAEFQKFFGPEGQFDKFFNDHLKTFINPNNGTPIMIDGQSLSVSENFIAQIAKVRAVRDIFFNADGIPTLRYSVEPVSMSGNISRSVLNIEGQLVPYSHGPSRPISILWPNALSSNQDISQLSAGNSGSITYSGLWSSFRLFDRAQVANVLPDSAELVFNVGNGQVKYKIRMSATDKNPFVLKPLTSLKLPEQL